jgi:hypothetical protein
MPPPVLPPPVSAPLLLLELEEELECEPCFE